MFEKLLSVLPYNPSVMHHMSFYSRRMREEAAIRRTGMIFILLAFFIQFFAVLSPPQPTLAQDDNSLVSGGISSARNAADICHANTRHYQDIMHYFGIRCANIAAAESLTIHSTGQNYYSMGWNPFNRAGSNEQPINVTKAGTVYVRKLSSFDTAGSSAYKALRVRTDDGRVFYILYNCGNLVSVGVPTAPRDGVTSGSLNACKYNMSIAATDPKCFPPCQYNASIAATDPGCFARCPLPGKQSLPQSSPQCRNECPYNSALDASDPKCFPPCQYNASISANSPQCFKPCQYNPAIPADSSQCYKPCQYNPLLAADDQNCKPCDKSVSQQDTAACVSVHKKGSNVTAKLNDANNSTAQPNDVITYTLSASNSGKVDVKDFTFQESISDVLDYADVVDLHGGTIDKYNVVTWPSETIKAGATATHQVTVKVKAAIPATPVDPNNPDHFNLVMSNTYGDTVNINVPAPPVRGVQATAETLPNTGPGTTMALLASVVIFGGYFYSRARLLARESELAIAENRVA